MRQELRSWLGMVVFSFLFMAGGVVSGLIHQTESINIAFGVFTAIFAFFIFSLVVSRSLPIKTKGELASYVTWFGILCPVVLYLQRMKHTNLYYLISFSIVFYVSSLLWVKRLKVA
jgi:predicted Co/Zn/Cd cation transporter (cation efflux family)